MLAVVFLTFCQAATIQIPVLDTKGDVYKTEGANDPLIYDSTIGHKKVIMLYADFSDAVMKIDTKERGRPTPRRLQQVHAGQLQRRLAGCRG